MADVDEYIDELLGAAMGREARVPISNAFAELHKNGKSVKTLGGHSDTYFAKQSDMAKLLPLDQSPIKRSTRLVTSGGIWAIFGDISEYKRVYPEGTENPHSKGWYELSIVDDYHAIEKPGVNQNPQAKGWYEYYQGHYILTSDTQTIKKEFVEVTPEEGDNPYAKGWYELIGGMYSTTSDTTVVSGKTYYEYVVTQKTYYEKTLSVGGLYVLTEDTSVDRTKTYYEKEFHIDWRDE